MPLTTRNNINKLTVREIQVAFYIVEGISTNIIAEKLGVKPNTISTFKKNIFKKLEVSSVVELYKKLRD
jgi:DNA-binding NarL/FixJ family response regulator